MKGQRRTLVALPGIPDVGHCYADLRNIAHIDRKLLGAKQRRHSMTDFAVLMLRAQLIDYFTRAKPELLMAALQAGLEEENAPAKD